MIIPRLLSDLTPEEKVSGLAELWLEVGPHCHLRCEYCFNSAGAVGADFDGGLDPLNDLWYMNVLDQFAALGGKVVGIPGFGEPFHSSNLARTMLILRHAASLGLRCRVFTTGDLIDDKLAAELLELPVSLGIKYNHYDPEKQDVIVGRRGYSAGRGKAISLLRRLGFGRGGGPVTRLSFVATTTGENMSVMGEIYKFCRLSGVVPDIDTLLHLGRAQSMVYGSDFVEKFRQLLLELSEFDRLVFGLEWPTLNTPAYVGKNCDRYQYHLYVDYHGRVSPCLGASKKGFYLGNVCRQPLAEMWNSDTMMRVRHREYSGKSAECSAFKSGSCHSCLGRFASVAESGVVTGGCSFFEE